MAYLRTEVNRIKLSGTGTFSTTFDPLLNAMALYNRVRSNVKVFTLILNSSDIEEVDKVRQKLDIELNNLCYRNKDLYEKLIKVKESKYYSTLKKDEKFVLDDLIRKSENEGVGLSAEQKQILSEIDLELDENKEAFRRNFTQGQKETFLLGSDTVFESGISQSYLELARQRANEKGYDGYAIELKPSQIDQFMPALEYVQSEDLRRQIYLAYIHRGKGEYDNREIIKRIGNLRLTRAQLLGKNTFAETILPSLMLKSVDRVRTFVDSVKPIFMKRVRSEIQVLADLKKDLTGNDKFFPWDVQFYAKKLENQKLGWDSSSLNPYLEMEQALRTSLDIIGNIYNIEFELAPSVETWHEDVRVYRAKDKTSRHSLGLFYFDLVERANKMPVAFAEELKAPGFYNPPDSGLTYWQEAHVFIGISIQRDMTHGKVFLTLRNLQSLFHEIGHGIHALSSKSRFPNYSSLNSPIDFVELPSQLLENWIYEPEVIRKIARHFETGEPPPEDWLDKIIESRSLNIGLKSLGRRGLMTTMDLAWHSITQPIDVDTDTFEMGNFKEWAEFPYLIEIAGSGTLNGYLFIHGYESRFHGYQWGEVLDRDASELFKQSSLFGPKIGLRLRETVLSHGAIIDPNLAYKKFRGRDPDPEAIIRKFETPPSIRQK